jgi:membrane protein insertase Oxa1/YidC/SpoIIIJ
VHVEPVAGLEVLELRVAAALELRLRVDADRHLLADVLAAVLPIINLVVMWTTQKLTPTPGMDPVQKKMMQAMPLVFGVMFALFPAGLVLYWVTNGTLSLLQQWWNIRRYSEVPAKA